MTAREDYAMSSPFTIIENGEASNLRASVAGDRVSIPAAELERTLGWTLKAEGLCRDEICVPVRNREALVDSSGIDLASFAAALGRPVAVDAAENTAALGTATHDQAARMASLDAPDFTLPDLDGQLHSLSDHRGKKVLLIAYASW
jgi:hypothetical protein